MQKKKPTFQRTKYRAYKKLGKSQKNKRVYRRASGRHNKVREKQKSRPRRVELGYRNNTLYRGLINEKTPVMIKCMKDLELITKECIGVLSKIGQKKKIEILNKAKQSGIDIANVNINKYLKKMERKLKNKNQTTKSEEEKK